MAETPLLEILFARLVAAYPRNQVEAPTMKVYVMHLRDLPDEALETAVGELINLSVFFPSIAEIRAVATEHLLDLPQEADALSQVEERLMWGRLPEEERQALSGPPMHALVKRALDHVGGFYAFRCAEQPTVIRGQFLKLYRDLRARELRDVQATPPMQIGGGRTALYPAIRAGQEPPRRLPAA